MDSTWGSTRSSFSSGTRGPRASARSMAYGRSRRAAPRAGLLLAAGLQPLPLAPHSKLYPPLVRTVNFGMCLCVLAREAKALQFRSNSAHHTTRLHALGRQHLQQTAMVQLFVRGLGPSSRAVSVGLDQSVAQLKQLIRVRVCGGRGMVRARRCCWMCAWVVCAWVRMHAKVVGRAAHGAQGACVRAHPHIPHACVHACSARMHAICGCMHVCAQMPLAPSDQLAPLSTPHRRCPLSPAVGATAGLFWGQHLHAHASMPTHTCTHACIRTPHPKSHHHTPAGPRVRPPGVPVPPAAG